MDWARLVWSTKIIPRHQFVLWLAFRERLTTRDRISKYMDIPDTKCVLCLTAEESIAHIFGDCSFIAPHWRRLAAAIRISAWPANWEGIRSLALIKAKRKSFTTNVFKCYFGAVLYQIWMERNARVFSRVIRNEIQVWGGDIDFDSNSLIHTWRRIPANDESWRLCQTLGIIFDEVVKTTIFKAR